MNANLKIALALGLLVAAVVGVTVITQFTEQEPESVKPSPNDVQVGGMPLSYDDPYLAYNPYSANYASREFDGFFEVNKEIHWATYLLRNRSAQTVKLTARSRSCVACTQARVAILSPEENRKIKTDVAMTAVIGSGYPSPPDVALFQRAESNNLPWQALDFENPEFSISVPPAVDETTPTWIVLQLGFEVKQTGQKTLSADIGMQSEGMRVATTQKFSVEFFGDAPERISPANFDFGPMPEGSEPRSLELFYWSTTRTKKTFSRPTIGGIKDDPFVKISAPEVLTQHELDLIARRASAEQKYSFRVRAGYKFSVTFRRDNPTNTGPKELDIGPVERLLTVTGSDGGSTGLTIHLTATILGVVALSEGDAVKLGEFPSRSGTHKEFKLISERNDLELEAINTGSGESRDHNPAGVTVTEVAKDTVEGNRKRWTYKVTVGPNALGGAITTQLLVFRVKGTGQYIRIPLRGVAHSR